MSCVENYTKSNNDESIAMSNFIKGEESAYKFYYCESENKYYIGNRCDRSYYAEIMIYPNGELVLFYGKSRYLPWGKTVNGYTFPSEPEEVDISEWLSVFVNAYSIAYQKSKESNLGVSLKMSRLKL